MRPVVTILDSTGIRSLPSLNIIAQYNSGTEVSDSCTQHGRGRLEHGSLDTGVGGGGIFTQDTDTMEYYVAKKKPKDTLLWIGMARVPRYFIK